MICHHKFNSTIHSSKSQAVNEGLYIPNTKPDIASRDLYINEYMRKIGKFKEGEPKDSVLIT